MLGWTDPQPTPDARRMLCCRTPLGTQLQSIVGGQFSPWKWLFANAHDRPRQFEPTSLSFLPTLGGLTRVPI